MIWHGLNNIYTHVDGGQKIYVFQCQNKIILREN